MPGSRGAAGGAAVIVGAALCQTVLSSNMDQPDGTSATAPVGHGGQLEHDAPLKGQSTLKHGIVVKQSEGLGWGFTTLRN